MTMARVLQWWLLALSSVLVAFILGYELGLIPWVWKLLTFIYTVIAFLTLEWRRWLPLSVGLLLEGAGRLHLLVLDIRQSHTKTTPRHRRSDSVSRGLRFVRQ